MRRRAGVSVLVVGAATALVAGGGLAWAGWTVAGGATAFTAEAARIPVMSRPRAELVGGSAKIVWTGVRLTSGRPVAGYVVIRRDGTDRAVACITAATDTDCRDRAARPGSIVTYVVHATVGAHWVGEDSPPSDPVQARGGPKVVSGDRQIDGDQMPTTPASPVLKHQNSLPGPTPAVDATTKPSESPSPSPSPSGSVPTDSPPA